ncbi:hypothetical protein GCM10027347_27570 [Larkinella harenae]
MINGSETFTLGANDGYVNVMGNTVPRMPNFPALKAKPGVVRGYVADLNGKPLSGAALGIRSTATGGFYSGASDETDANGYYEITIPWGAAEFYAAGYTIDYGEGRAVMSLASADGKLGNFPSADGLVKNFVLLSYGVFSKDILSQKPHDQSNYAGGVVSISYHVSDPEDYYIPPHYIPKDAEIEVTLTPDGPGLYGENKTFIIRKKVQLYEYGFQILNIPVGRYTIRAKISGGKELRMEAIGRYATIYPYFGLKPATATGTAKILFTPDIDSENRTTLPNRSNWGSLQVQVEVPE